MTSAHATPPAFDPAAIRGVVFDLDGTLVDSYSAITASVNAARSACNLSPLTETAVRGLVGHGLETLLERVLGVEHVASGVQVFRDRYAQVYASGTRLLPGAQATLSGLHEAGFHVVVATNKPARFGRPILTTLGVGQLVSAVFGPDVAGATKPDPAMLRLCMRHMGLRESETVYVGDMVLDVESARRAGVPVLLVAGGSSSAEELAATGERVLSRLTELLDLLQPSRKKPASARGPASGNV